MSKYRVGDEIPSEIISNITWVIKGTDNWEGEEVYLIHPKCGSGPWIKERFLVDPKSTTDNELEL
jgi:hypothetical protein